MDEMSLEDWGALWDAMSRSRGHEIIVDGVVVPPGDVRIKVLSFLKKTRKGIVADLRELATRHPEQRAWTETLALRYEKGEEIVLHRPNALPTPQETKMSAEDRDIIEELIEDYRTGNDITSKMVDDEHECRRRGDRSGGMPVRIVEALRRVLQVTT
jgi:hypothetical protein